MQGSRGASRMEGGESLKPLRRSHAWRPRGAGKAGGHSWMLESQALCSPHFFQYRLYSRAEGGRWLRRCRWAGRLGR